MREGNPNRFPSSSCKPKTIRQYINLYLIYKTKIIIEEILFTLLQRRKLHIFNIKFNILGPEITKVRLDLVTLYFIKHIDKKKWVP